MITLKGQKSEYYFDVARPLKKPGKFSVVFKGENENGESFLIKQLNIYSSANIHESKITHPSFIKSKECINSDGCPYLIRPFVEGVSLNELNNTNWFSSEKKLEFLKKIIRELGEALASLHTLQLVHLDIRPHNIIINDSKDNKGSIVSIIDLDMVRPFNSNEEIKHFPLIYAAPELLLKKNKLIDNRTDIYALSITLYELIFNKRPFLHANPELILHLMLNKKLDYVNNRTCSFVDILNKAAGKNPFNLPPASLEEEQVEELLLSGMNSRYGNVLEFTNELMNQIKLDNNWFARLSQFFQS
ncbi:MAG: protein kinase domain-containing protein [Bacteroidota bacterium]